MDVFFPVIDVRRVIQVWQIKLTLHFVSDEGNMLDCACLAGVAALRHYRRPEVEVVGEDVIIVSSPYLDSNQLPLRFSSSLDNM